MIKKSFFIIFFYLLIYPCLSFAFEKEIGVMVEARGVRLKRAADGNPFPAGSGTDLFVGDTILTGSGGSVKLYFIDKTIINVGPDSEIEIKEYMFDIPSKKVKSIINTFKGVFRTIITDMFRKDGDFQFKSPTAIAGVRGTDFFIEVLDTGETLWTTKRGMIAVRGINDSILNEILVAEMEQIRVGTDGHIGELIKIDPHIIINLKKKTAIKMDAVKTRLENPSQAPGKNKPSKQVVSTMNGNQNSTLSSSAEKLLKLLGEDEKNKDLKNNSDSSENTDSEESTKEEDLDKFMNEAESEFDSESLVPPVEQEPADTVKVNVYTNFPKID